jgi:NAD(P)-dependent dehydrogenase (short-subunit alcohol dehydrogenase family)
MARFEDKVLLVTGGARGLGLAIAKRFYSEGARIARVDMNEDSLASTWPDFPDSERLHDVVADVRDGQQVKDAVAQAVDQFGAIDVLANVAGVAFLESFLETTEEQLDHVLSVNLRGTFLVAQAVARHMVQRRGGAIINMSSKNGLRGEVGYSAYNATKAGVILLTQVMAVELAEHNIRVNCVCPGYIVTPMAEEIDPPEFMKFYAKRCVPMNRLGRPEEVAGVFAFLASDDASFITGQSIVCDGGQIAHDGRKMDVWKGP